MCQSSVYQTLKANQGKWIKAKVIASKIGVSISSVQLSLKKLYEWGDIQRRELKYNQKWYEWSVR